MGFSVILLIGGGIAVILLVIGIVISSRGENEDVTSVPAASPPESQTPFTIEGTAMGTEVMPEPSTSYGVDGFKLAGRPLVKKCPYCSEVISYEATTCKFCHQHLSSVPNSPASASQNYAGFWIRVGASLLDSIVLAIGGAIIGGMVGFVWGLLFGSDDASMTTLQCVVYVISVIFAWLYNAGMESSARQATLGKMAAGIRVTDLKGQRISFGKATARYICKFFSGLVLGIGYLMVIWDGQKQALHDKMAGTLVVRG